MQSATTTPHMLLVRRYRNDELVLYQPATGNGTWYCRVKIGPNKYAHRSCKTKSDNEAYDIANDIFREIKTKLEHGIAISKRTVARAIEEWLEHNKRQLEVKQLSPDMARIHSMSMRYWKEYFAKTPLESISTEHMENYLPWRLGYWNGKEIRHVNVKPNPADRTIQLEYQSMYACLKWAVKRGFLRHEKMPDYRYKVGTKNRRPAFTFEQYWRFTRFLLGYPRDTKDKRIRWYRELLRHYVHVMANSGLRVGEARGLRWSDLEEFTDNHGDKNFYIKVRVSKTKPRDVVPRSKCYQHLVHWRSLAKFTGPNDYVFHTEKGKPITDLREGFNKAVSLALSGGGRGSATQEEIDALTIYSLRHTFISFCIRYAKQYDLYLLAKNCGTSVQMIEQYYSDVIPRDKATELGRMERPVGPEPEKSWP